MDRYEEKLTPILSEIIRLWEIPGLAVSVVQNDQVEYMQGFGVQSLDTHIPVSLDSLFCVASVSKVFVATAVMQLSERGLIDLDARIVQYLPYFWLGDERSAQITIRQALSHTSGMPDLTDFEYDDLWKHPEVDEDALERYVRGLGRRRLLSDPGEEFHYSNIAYNVLGDVIAKVSGMPFELYMKEQLLLPSGMPESTFLVSQIPIELLALPHLRAPEMIASPFYPYHRGDAPASSMHTNIREISNWMRMCLRRGYLDGHEIVRPATFDLMGIPVVKRGWPPFYEEMGLGWNVGHFQGEKTLSHGGFGAGWTDQLVLLPESGRGLAILSLDESYSIYRIRQAILDVLYDQEPKVDTVSWAVPICQALAKGGSQAAFARFEDLKKSGTESFWFDEELLITPALHLMILDKPEMAVDLLKLNLLAFPEYDGTYHYLANAYLQQGEPEKAEEILLKALSIHPDNTEAVLLLKVARNRVSGLHPRPV